MNNKPYKVSVSLDKDLIAENRVGKCPSPLLATRPMRRLSDIFPLHEAVHHKTG